MKQMTSPSDMVSLSGPARQRLNKWLKEKDYGSVIDGEFVPFLQLPIGVMIEWLLDNNFNVPKVTGYDYCDELFNHVKDILEQKN